MMIRKRLIFVSVLGLALAFFLILPTEARADPYGFYNITNNNATDAAIGEAQLSMNVTSVSPTQVLFEFMNAGPAASSITDVYYDDGAWLWSIASLVGSAGVSFSVPATPPDLPGGNSISPPFVATINLTADSDPPAQPNGVNPGEWLQVVLNLVPSQSFADVISALNTGGLRVGIHVQGFASGGSESFVNNPFPIPVPGAVLLGLLGLSAAGLKLRKYV